MLHTHLSAFLIPHIGCIYFLLRLSVILDFIYHYINRQHQQQQVNRDYEPLTFVFVFSVVLFSIEFIRRPEMNDW